jgi:hypothetical protein
VHSSTHLRVTQNSERNTNRSALSGNFKCSKSELIHTKYPSKFLHKGKRVNIIFSAHGRQCRSYFNADSALILCIKHRDKMLLMWPFMCLLFSTGTVKVYTLHASDIRCPSNRKSAVWPWTSYPFDFVTLQGTHLLTNTGVFMYTGKYALQDIPYLLDEPRVSSTNYYNECTYSNSKPQPQPHSYFLTLWCQILERTTICCINVFHMTCLVLR